MHMPRQSRYLPPLLIAAEHGCTPAKLADVLAITVERATVVLRYWERQGYVTPSYFDHGGRTRASFTLTARGIVALHEQRFVPLDAPTHAPNLEDVWS
jgi:hypothetical protein